MPVFTRFKIDKHGRSMYRQNGNKLTTVRFGASQFTGTPPETVTIEAENMAPAVAAGKLTKEERKAREAAIPAEVRKAARDAAKQAKAAVLKAAGIGG